MKKLLLLIGVILVVLTGCNEKEKEAAVGKKESPEEINKEEQEVTAEESDANASSETAAGQTKKEMSEDEFQYYSSSRVYIPFHFYNVLPGNPISGREELLGGSFSSSLEEFRKQFLSRDGRIVELVVSVYPDQQSPDLKTLQEKYAELTYEEDEETQSVHWVTNNVHSQIVYYRHNDFEPLEKEQMIKDVKKRPYFFGEGFYEEKVVSPSYLYNYTFENLDNEIKNKLAVRGAIKQWGEYTDGTKNVEKSIINTFDQQLDAKDAEQIAKEFWEALKENAKNDPKIDYSLWLDSPYKIEFVSNNSVYYTYEVE